ncbi:hypothetical protein ACFQ4N_02195 [Oceanobacillus iheyensis]|uniref:hypothetical protein n=1 Tax=Oceanobacillus iheyensis TaxID=182710 RepID=UPI00363E625B
MKVKGLKKKVVAGVLATSVVVSSSVVFASTPAGEGLRDWYNGLFNESVASIESEAESMTTERFNELESEYAQIKSDAAIDIDLSRELSTGQSLDEIISAKLDHIEGIDAEKAAILEDIGYEYYNVFLDAYLEIDRLANEGEAFATNDLTNYTSELGEEAVTQLTSDLTTAKDNAVQELEDAIQAAQEELAAEVSSHEAATIENISDWLGWTIDDLRASVTTLLDDLVAEQEAIIVAKAQELEDDAKAALDAVIDGINQ